MAARLRRVLAKLQVPKGLTRTATTLALLCAAVVPVSIASAGELDVRGAAYDEVTTRLAAEHDAIGTTSVGSALLDSGLPWGWGTIVQFSDAIDPVGGGFENLREMFERFAGFATFVLLLVAVLWAFLLRRDTFVSEMAKLSVHLLTVVIVGFYGYILFDAALYKGVAIPLASALVEGDLQRSVLKGVHSDLEVDDIVADLHLQNYDQACVAAAASETASSMMGDVEGKCEGGSALRRARLVQEAALIVGGTVTPEEAQEVGECVNARFGWAGKAVCKANEAMAKVEGALDSIAQRLTETLFGWLITLQRIFMFGVMLFAWLFVVAARALSLSAATLMFAASILPSGRGKFAAWFAGHAKLCFKPVAIAFGFLIYFAIQAVLFLNLDVSGLYGLPLQLCLLVAFLVILKNADKMTSTLIGDVTRVAGDIGAKFQSTAFKGAVAAGTMVAGAAAAGGSAVAGTATAGTGAARAARAAGRAVAGAKGAVKGMQAKFGPKTPDALKKAGGALKNNLSADAATLKATGKTAAGGGRAAVKSGRFGYELAGELEQKGAVGGLMAGVARAKAVAAESRKVRREEGEARRVGVSKEDEQKALAHARTRADRQKMLQDIAPGREAAAREREDLSPPLSSQHDARLRELAQETDRSKVTTDEIVELRAGGVDALVEALRQSVADGKGISFKVEPDGTRSLDETSRRVATDLAASNTQFRKTMTRLGKGVYGPDVPMVYASTGEQVPDVGKIVSRSAAAMAAFQAAAAMSDDVQGEVQRREIVSVRAGVEPESVKEYAIRALPAERAEGLSDDDLKKEAARGARMAWLAAASEDGRVAAGYPAGPVTADMMVRAGTDSALDDRVARDGFGRADSMKQLSPEAQDAVLESFSVYAEHLNRMEKRAAQDGVHSWGMDIKHYVRSREESYNAHEESMFHDIAQSLGTEASQAEVFQAAMEKAEAWVRQSNAELARELDKGGQARESLLMQRVFLPEKAWVDRYKA